jgi:hypothetical protein
VTSFQLDEYPYRSLSLYNKLQIYLIMLKYLTFCLFITTSSLIFAQSTELELSLKKAELSRLKAWADKDISEIIRIESGARGFGAQSSSLRKPVADELLLVQWTKFLERVTFEFQVEELSYKFIGNIGLVAGPFFRKDFVDGKEVIAQKIRYTATYQHDGDNWKCLQFHRSKLPDDETYFNEILELGGPDEN